MRLLVTGGLGFIGSNFIRYMLENYDDIRILNLDKISYGANPSNLKGIEQNKRYRFRRCDISNRRLVNRLIKDNDAVINFAAESHVDRSIADPWPFFTSNTEGVLTLLEATRCSRGKVRFIQVGTDESYGDIIDGSSNEADALSPSSPYSASKASADLLCLAHQRTYGLDVIVTRCTNNFGPYQSPEKLIPKAIARAKLGLKIPLYGSGRNIRDWIYVMDHCTALRTVLEKGVSGEVYNIAGGNEYENLDIIRRVLKIMEKDEDLIEFVEDRPGHDLRYSINASKIGKELKWKPGYDFNDALRLTVTWYLENERWWRPLIGRRLLHPTPWKLKW